VARAAVGDRGFIGLTTGHGDSGPERAFRSIAWGLALFAAVALVAGLLALGQAVARHVQLSRDTVRDASALGMTRRQTASAIALPVTGSTSLGLLTGSLAALALSPLFPISVARRAEVDRGLELDPLVHVGGAASGILLVGLITATLAWRLAGASPATAAGRRPRGASALASPLGRLSPSAAVGVGSVAGRRLVGIRPGTAVAGAIVAVAGSVAVLVFTASHTTAVGHPAHYGWTWDAAPDLYTQEPWELVEELTHDDRVAAVGGGFCDELSLAGRPVPTCAYMTISGAIGPTLVAGRAPSSDDEVALGAGTADELGVGIGDVVRLDGTTGGGTEHRDLVVVGTSVNSTLGRDGGRPAIGAVVAPDVLTSATGKDLLEVESSNLLLDLAPSADPDAVRRALAADFPMRFPVSSEPIPPELLVQIDRVRPTLLALVGLIAVLGVIGLGHYLGLSIRQRRGELAVLRSLGFVRRQVRASVTWQALAVSSVGIVIGVPLGVVVGRWSWLAAVGNLGIVDAPTTPIVALAAVCAAMAIGTALVAVLPGLAAGRRRPAQDLRTE
jgi:predicted lysophospholipase L1 biosynthesis ABC-type transport system permease subunit